MEETHLSRKGRHSARSFRSIEPRLAKFRAQRDSWSCADQETSSTKVHYACLPLSNEIMNSSQVLSDVGKPIKDEIRA